MCRLDEGAKPRAAIHTEGMIDFIPCRSVDAGTIPRCEGVTVDNKVRWLAEDKNTAPIFRRCLDGLPWRPDTFVNHVLHFRVRHRSASVGRVGEIIISCLQAA